MLTEFQIGYDKGGMLISFQSFGNLLASFLGGIISAYIGRKNAILVLSFMTSLGFLGMVVSSTPLLLIIPFFLTGIGRGSVSNLSNTIVNEVSDGNPKDLNILHTFFAIGAFIAPFFASWSLSKGFSWRFVLIVISILSALMTIYFSTTKIENTKRTRSRKEEKGIRSLDFLKNMDFYLSAGILFFYVGVEHAVNSWIVTYLKDTGIMSTSLAQKVLSILWVIIIFGRLFVAYISKRVDKRTILLGSSIGALIFYLLFIISSSIWAIVACILGLGFFLAGIYPTALSNASRALKGSSLAMGTILAIAGLGGIVMPYITGVIAEIYGIKGGMVAVGFAASLMFLIAFINRLRKFKDASSG